MVFYSLAALGAKRDKRHSTGIYYLKHASTCQSRYSSGITGHDVHDIVSFGKPERGKKARKGWVISLRWIVLSFVKPILYTYIVPRLYSV